MEDHLKRAEIAEALTPTISKRPRSDVLEESPLLVPSSDLLEKIDVPSASGANSDPSALFTSVIGKNYDVFLSFRGPDTRKGFVDHLYQRFKAVGLMCHTNPVFRDDEDLAFGEKIGENLISAIERSKVSIPVISENYGASQWCLRELIKIMECVERGEQNVLPVLYKVKPKHVRELKGAFGKAFKSRMHLFEEDVKQQGQEALRKAVDSRVFESEKFADGHEGQLVKKLVEIILRQQQYDFPPPLPTDLVGIEDRVAEVMKLVDIACQDTRIIGIWGMGGIGKTTLATIVYSKLFDRFQWRSSLKDIRETTKSKGMEHVQSLLLSDMRKHPQSTVRDLETGINMIRLSCEKKKVLILLDDVDCRDHLDNLIGGCNFGSGSRIIVTCRDMALLDSEYRSYELKEMNCKDSMLLFSRYAFEGERPPTNLVTLSSDVVATTGGLPLALTVIGSLLKRKDKNIWTETWEKLRKMPLNDVQEKLKLSYNALEDNEKQMFLDIACFFIGIDKRIATYLWEDLQLYPNSGLARMIELSLIKIDDKNRLRMHDQLRDLGRAMACRKEMRPWHWSRPWDEEVIKTLRHKEENETIEALHLNERGSREFMERGSFKKMPNLKFLHVKDVDFDGDFKGSLAELRWLKWERCCDSFEATNFHLEKLVVLDSSGDYISKNRISENWRGWSSIKMDMLKVLNLSGCVNLRSTPNLSALKNLEMLILERCACLEEIDPSIGYAKCLVSLNLRYCGSLQKLPKELGLLKELEELLMDETDIKEIPPCIGSLKRLKILSAVGCGSLTQIPSSICRPVNSSTLNLTTSETLQKLGSRELQRLYLMGCYRLKQIPSSIGELKKLVELDLSYTKIKELPESIGKLKNLKILRIPHSEIEKLPSSIGKLESLQELDASGCHELEGQFLGDIGGLFSLRTLQLGKAKISHLPEHLSQLSTLSHLDLLYCSELVSLPDPPSGLSSLQLTCRSNTLPLVSHLSHLKKLTLHCCMFLESIPELPSNIRKLCVWKCPMLKKLPNLSNLRSLMELELSQCYGLMEFNGLEALESLTKLDVSISMQLPNLNNFEDLELWTNLDLQSYDGEADNLHELQGISHLKSLEVLNISARKHIQRLDLSKSEHLKRLIINDCESLVEIRCHDKIESLDHFDRNGCKSLTIPDFSA